MEIFCLIPQTQNTTTVKKVLKILDKNEVLELEKIQTELESVQVFTKEIPWASKRIFYALVAWAFHLYRKQRQQEEASPPPNRFKISLTNLKKIIGLNIKYKNYKYLKSCLLKLDARFTFSQKMQEREIWGFFHLLESPVLETTERKVVLEYSLPNVIYKFFCGDKNIFTNVLYYKIDLNIFKNIKGKYAQRIYELVSRYDKVEVPKMKIDDFLKVIGVERKGAYTKFYRIKNKILDRAIKELNENEYCPYRISYQLFKEWKEYKYIKIKFKRKENYVDIGKLEEIELWEEIEKKEAEMLKNNFKALKERQEKEEEEIKEIVEDTFGGAVIEEEFQEIIKILPKKEVNPTLKQAIYSAIKEKGFEYTKANVEYSISQQRKNLGGFLVAALAADYAKYFEHKKEKEEEEVKNREKEETINKIRKIKAFKFRKANQIFLIKSINIDENIIFVFDGEKETSLSLDSVLNAFKNGEIEDINLEGIENTVKDITEKAKLKVEEIISNKTEEYYRFKNKYSYLLKEDMLKKAIFIDIYRKIVDSLELGQIEKTYLKLNLPKAK